MERYEAYKDSGVEWIGEIPAGWNLIVAKRYARISNGSDPVTEGDTPVYGSSGVAFKTCGESKLAPAVLLGRKGTIESPSYIDHPYWNVDTAFDVKTDEVVMRLRYYFYLATCFDYARYQTSTAVPSMTQTDYGNMRTPVPSVPEQQAIADYLDAKTAEIDALVADCEREVGLLREYRKAVISEAVTKGLDPDAPMKDSGIEWIGEIPDGWEVVGFKTYLNGIIDYRGRTPEKVDDGVFLITGRNIKQGRIHYEFSQEYMRPEDFDTIMSRGRLKVGNVLFTMEAPLGEVALIDRDDCAAAQRIIQLCCNEEELFGAFLVYWIMSDEFQSNLQTYATGSTASGIKASKLGMLRLVHPPMETQQSIVDYLNAKTAEIDSLIEAKQSMADKLREYRRSLISEAVTGKFKVPGV